MDKVKKAWRGIRLLKAMGRQGRPVGTTTLTKEQFETMVIDACHTLQAKEEKVTQESVADIIPLSGDRQLRRYLREFGITWASITQKKPDINSDTINALKIARGVCHP